MQEVTSSSQTSDPQEYSVLMADDNSSESKMADLIQRKIFVRVFYPLAFTFTYLLHKVLFWASVSIEKNVLKKNLSTCR